MKKACLWMMLLLLPLMLLSIGGREAAAAGSGKIVLDSRELQLPKEVVLENVNGSVMIPIRVVAENLGYKVNWEKNTKAVTVSQDGKTLQMRVGRKTADADGVTLSLNAAPKQAGGTVLVPIRFVSEQFGLKVGWDNADKTVYLSSGESAVLPTPAPSPSAVPGTQTSPGVTPTPSAVPLPSASPSPSASPGMTAAPGATAPSAAAQVTGAAFINNQLLISVSGAVQPTVSKMDNPSRIVVDLAGVSFAASFQGGSGASLVTGTAGSPQGKLDAAGYPLISEVRYALFSSSPSTVRFVIQSTSPLPYTVNTDASTGMITVDLNVQPSAPAAPGIPAGGSGGKPIVVLDAGHGGKQPGAVSVTKKLEKDFNLAVILKAAALLESDGRVSVVLTRSGDSTLGLQDRVNIAKNAGADLFISLHANSLDSSYPNYTSVNGSETYYSRSESLPLAKIMHKHLVAGTGFKDNGVRSKSLHVTRETTMPAVLLEAGYLTNASNEAALYTVQLQDNLAREIAAGILEYLGLQPI